MSQTAIGPASGYPLTFGQILDRIFKLLRAKARLFLGIALVPAAAMGLVYALMVGSLLFSGLMSQRQRQPIPWHVRPVLTAGVGLGFFGAGCLLMLLVYALFEAAAIYAALEVDHGRDVSVRSAYAVAWRHAGRYVWVMMLRALYVAGPIVALAVVVGGSAYFAAQSEGGTLGPGTMFLLIPLILLLYLGAMVYAVLLSLRLALVVPASIAEDLEGNDAVKRSLALTRNAKGRIFLVFLVVYAAGYAALMALELGCGMLAGLGALVGMVAHLQIKPPWSYVGGGLVVTLAMGVMLLWVAAMWAGYAIAFGVLYHDQRLRGEMTGLGAGAGMSAGI